MFYIYTIENMINGKLYIGQTMDRRDKNARWNEHKLDARKGNTKMPIHRAMKKYGDENFIFTIFEAYSSLEEVRQAEKYWIAYLRGQNIELYNISDGGGGWGSYKRGPRTPEHTAKLKCFKKGNVSHTKGKFLSKETKNKISQSNRKISDLQRQEIKNLYITGEYSQKELGIQFNIDTSQISRIVNNKTGPRGINND